MTVLKRVLRVFYVTSIVILMGACESIAPTPTVTATATIVPSLTPFIPSITPTVTPSPTNVPTATPDYCNSAQWQDKIQVISQDLFTAFEPGGPIALDRILGEQNPAWANFRQTDHGEVRSAGIIFHETSMGPELGTGINPAVILVTYGVERNWELPVNGDLVTEVDRIRALLHQRETYWILGTIDLSQYPMVANAATYALYYYFNGDLSKLEDWCRTYVRVFNESPLK